ncbi:MAG: response regulator transcription factor, partial [Sphingobacteriales bacterium]
MTQIGLIDDHTMFRRGLKSLIEVNPNYSVIIEAANGKEFIKKLETHPLPEIVLLDIKMAEMDGYETAKWIQDNHPQILVLALSTMDSDLSIIQMILNGARGYILKGADPDELKLAFEEVKSIGYYFNNEVSRKVISNIRHIVNDKDGIGVALRLN